MSYLKLSLIRHAESLGNVQKIMEGQSSTALSKVGQAQARRLGEALQSQAWPTHIYSSPLLRAKQTAEAITQALTHSNHAFAYQETPALQELHQGIFQGLTWLQAEAKYPELCEQLMSTTTWQPIPDAETLSAARNRAKSWLKYLLDSHVADDVIWVVSHEGFLQHLISAVMGCDRTWQIRIPHTAIFEFWLAHPATNTQTDSAQLARQEILRKNRLNSEFWIVHRFNDCSHLQSAFKAEA